MRYNFGQSQTRHFSPTCTGVLLWILILIAFAMLGQALIRANLGEFRDVVTAHQIHSATMSFLTTLADFQILSVDSALALVITLLGLAIARYHFASSQQPLLVFQNLRRAPSADSSQPAHDSSNPLTREVTIVNAGAGRAVIESVGYRIIFNTNEHEQIVDQDELIPTLCKVLNDVCFSDLWLARFTPGVAIAPEKSIIFLQYAKSFHSAVLAIDVRFVFRDIVGFRYHKDYRCIDNPKNRLRDATNPACSQPPTRTTSPNQDNRLDVQPTVDKAFDEQ